MRKPRLAGADSACGTSLGKLGSTPFGMKSAIPKEATDPRAGVHSPPKWLPLQNVLLAACVIAAVAGIAEALNAATGFPFGLRTFGGNERSTVSLLCASVPPAVCIVALLSARGVAKLLLLPWRASDRYGYGLLALNALLGTLPLVGLDLLATRVAHWWHWRDSAWHWQGIALPNLAGWLCVNVLALLLATPALIDKRPVQPPPALLPLAVWSVLNLALLAGCVSRVSDSAVAVLAAPVALVTVLTFQRHRKAVANCGRPAGRE